MTKPVPVARAIPCCCTPARREMRPNASRPTPLGLPVDASTPIDAAMSFFIGWWKRMHRGPNGLITVALKTVTCPDATGKPARYVWEVCKWPMYRGYEWTFVCWLIDGDGMWSRSFSTRRAALAYFAQSPAAVMLS